MFTGQLFVCVNCLCILWKYAVFEIVLMCSILLFQCVPESAEVGPKTISNVVLLNEWVDGFKFWFKLALFNFSHYAHTARFWLFLLILITSYVACVWPEHYRSQHLTGLYELCTYASEIGVFHVGAWEENQQLGSLKHATLYTIAYANDFLWSS